MAPNKFLAKLASDWRNPDGLFVIQPEEVDSLLLPLLVGRLPGVDKVTREKLARLGIKTVSDLRGLDLSTLEQQFGRYGVRLYELARGIDESEVVPDRPTKSISVEDTFERDVALAETDPMIRRLAEKLWSASSKESRIARTVVVKLKSSEFRILTLLSCVGHSDERRTGKGHPDAVRHGCPRKAGISGQERGGITFEDRSSANTKSAYPIRVSVANDREPSDSFHVGVRELDPPTNSGRRRSGENSGSAVLPVVLLRRPPRFEPN